MYTTIVISCDCFAQSMLHGFLQRSLVCLHPHLALTTFRYLHLFLRRHQHEEANDGYAESEVRAYDLEAKHDSLVVKFTRWLHLCLPLPFRLICCALELCLPLKLVRGARIVFSIPVPRRVTTSGSTMS
uniref:Uncharacterized protein n=1 Tax=Coccolithus braarudii TaxID=221442 RepID=A0A7S0LIC4_9EUKA